MGDGLFKNQLLFFSGKGGVGKSAVSLACALRAQALGKKVLHVVFSRPPFANDSLGIEILTANPRECLLEYVATKAGAFHLDKLLNLVTQNQMVTHFLDAVPGLNELLILGKIHSLVSKDYDLVVVDAPSTGHGFSLLEVPKIVRQAVSIGPLRTETEKMIELFSDPLRTRLCLVALAEDMSVEETIEFSQKVKSSHTVPLGPVFLNSLLPAFPEDFHRFPSHPAFDAARFYAKRLAIQAKHQQTLTHHFSEIIPLPFLPSGISGIAALRALGEEIPA